MNLFLRTKWICFLELNESVVKDESDVKVQFAYVGTLVTILVLHEPGILPLDIWCDIMYMARWTSGVTSQQSNIFLSLLICLFNEYSSEEELR